MQDFRRVGLLEVGHLDADRVDPGEDVGDHAILTGRVHRLQNNNHPVGPLGVQDLL